MSGSTPASLHSQIYPLSVVAFLLLKCSKSPLWPDHLCLKVFFVMPTQVSSLGPPATVAWYKTLEVVHLPGRGHFCFSRQLHLGATTSSPPIDFRNTLELFLAISNPILGRQRQLSFSVRLLNTGCSIFPGGKCLSMSLKNFFPTFVLTSSEKGGLNHTILFLFLLVLFFLIVSGGSNCSLWLQPFLSNSAW